MTSQRLPRNRIRKQIKLIAHACHHIVQGLIRGDYAAIKVWSEKIHNYANELKAITLAQDFTTKDSP